MRRDRRSRGGASGGATGKRGRERGRDRFYKLATSTARGSTFRASHRRRLAAEDEDARRRRRIAVDGWSTFTRLVPGGVDDPAATSAMEAIRAAFAPEDARSGARCSVRTRVDHGWDAGGKLVIPAALRARRRTRRADQQQVEAHRGSRGGDNGPAEIKETWEQIATRTEGRAAPARIRAAGTRCDVRSDWPAARAASRRPSARADPHEEERRPAASASMSPLPRVSRRRISREARAAPHPAAAEQPAAMTRELGAESERSCGCVIQRRARPALRSAVVMGDAARGHRRPRASRQPTHEV